MEWNDKGFLIEKKRYNENSLLAEIYTENHGKVVGLIFGATSKKIKGYLELGNFLHVNYKYKDDNKIGYFNVEIDEVNTPIYLDNKKKLFCIIYAMNLVKILTVENQENKNIYDLLKNFFLILDNDKWLKNFIFWELNFYKCIGYDIDFKNYVESVTIDGETKFVVEPSKKIIPNFLISNDFQVKNNKDIVDGFKIVGEFLDKSILKPNNINYPLSRTELGNLIKSI